MSRGSTWAILNFKFSNFQIFKFSIFFKFSNFSNFQIFSGSQLLSDFQTFFVCHLPWLKVMILGTCQATFIFPSRLKTHLFSLSSLSSFMAKGHLPSLWHGKKLLFTCLGSKLNYLIFHGYKSSSRGKRSSLNVSSIKCSIFILGTYQATFVCMSMLKTYLWFSLSSAMAKGNLSSAKQLLFWRPGSKLI